MQRMPRVHPLAEEEEPILQHCFEHRPFTHRPLLEQIILGVHARGDFMSSALKHHSARGSKVDPDIRAIELFLHEERGIRDEVQRLLLAQIFIVLRAA